MRILGIAVILAGWLLAVGGLFITASNGGRALFAVVGIAVTISGILGVLNPFYQTRAVWKK